MLDDEGEPPSLAAVDVDGRSVRCVLTASERIADDRGADATGDVTGVDAVESVRVDEWYPLARLVEALDDLSAVAGREGVTEVGWEFAANVTFSADVETIPDALTALDHRFRDRHRGDAGGYTFRQIGATDGRIECHTPYPCAFDRGLVAGVADAHADGFVCLSAVGRCREDGADRCTYQLTW